MMITEFIREAVSEHQVYFLLTAYVEAVRYGDRFECLPAPMRGLPVADVEDVKGRVDALSGLSRSQRVADGCDHSLLIEALDIFSAAHGRLGALERARRARLAA